MSGDYPVDVTQHPFYDALTYVGNTNLNQFKTLDETGQIGYLDAMAAAAGTTWKNMMSQGRQGDESVGYHVFQKCFTIANPDVRERFTGSALFEMERLYANFAKRHTLPVFQRRIQDLRDQQAQQKGVATATNAKVKKPQKRDLEAFKTYTQINISDLMLYKINKGKKLTGTLASNAGCLIGVNTMLQDDNGEVVELGLYNQLGDNSYKTVDTVFPKGRSITIIEPYLKIFNSGVVGIRVDSPSDIIFNDGFCGEGLTDAKLKGNEQVASKNYRTAVNIYETVLRTNTDVDVIIALLSNRAQAYIKTGNYAQALPDAAACLFIRPDHAKSRLRYEAALTELTNQLADVIQQLPEDLLTPASEPSAQYKEHGNAFYSKQDYPNAVVEYTKGLNCEEAVEAGNILSNLSLCYEKLGLYEWAICSCSAAMRLGIKPATVQKCWYRIAGCSIQVREFDASEKAASFITDSVYRTTINVSSQHARNWCLHGPEKSALTTHETEERMDISLPPDALPEFSFMQWVHPSLYIKRVEGKGRGVFCNRIIKAGTAILVDWPLVVAQGTGENSRNAPEKEKARNHLMFLNTRDGYCSRMLNNLTPGSLDMPVVPFPRLFRNVHAASPFIVESKSDRACETDIDDIIRKNSFGSKNTLSLFPVMSMVNHADSPNATLMETCSGKTELHLTILFLTEEVKAGTEITIQYSDNKQALKNTWGIGV